MIPLSKLKDEIKQNGVVVHTPHGSYRLTEELIDDQIYPINLRQKIYEIFCEDDIIDDPTI